MEKNLEKKMTLIEHLEELRKRLLICFAVIFVASVISFAFVEQLRELITYSTNDKLIFIGLTEAFLTNLRIAILTGVFASVPVIFFHFWRFVLPALTGNEMKNALVLTLGTLIFFFLGTFFAFTIILPITIDFFLSFAAEGLDPALSYRVYISYCAGMLLAFGLVFELPIAIFLLSTMELVSAAFLSKVRTLAILIIFIVSAIITPPDIISQILMSLPLIILYEFSILMARIIERRKRR